MPTNQERSARLDAMRAESLLGGGQERIDQQHARGKLTARERLELLLDAGSFVELDAFVTNRNPEVETAFLGDGVVTGHGTIDGRLVFVFSQDFTVFGGSLSEAYAEKICKVMDLAMKVGAPIVGLNDSGGARIQEGVVSLGGYADIFLRNTLASGVVPQLSVVMGPCAGGAVYSPAITDFTIMVEGTSYMFVTGPERREGGHPRGRRRGDAGRGDDAHDPQRRRASGRARRGRGARSGAADPRPPAPEQPGRRAARLGHRRRRTGAKPRSTRSCPTIRASPTTCTASSSSSSTTPSSSRSSRAGRRTSSPGSRASADAASASSRSSRRSWPARSTSTRRRRPRGSSGPATASTCRWSPSSTCRDSCRASRQEHGGIIRHGAKLLYAYCEATVPKLTVITRKAYGGAYDVMSSKHVRGDINLAWPTAEIAVMGAEGAVNILHRDAIDAARGPGGRTGATRRRLRGAVRQSVRRGGTRLRRRCHPPVRYAAAADRRVGDAGRQARHEPAEEARQHAAVTAPSRPAARRGVFAQGQWPALQADPHRQPR